MNNLAPIVLFVYNRPWHTQQTLEALQKNDLATQSELFIYADGAKQENDTKVAEVRQYINTIFGFKKITIIERDKNWGLADNIIDGVTEIVNKFGQIIVLEDDIVTSVGFLKYMNEALKMYEDEEKVMHISSFIPKSGFSFILPSTFFLRFMSCWGWGTWKQAWDKIQLSPNEIWNKINNARSLKEYNLDGVLSFHEQLLGNINGSLYTWAIKWYSTIFLEKGLCLYPKHSLSDNIGQDGSGVNYNTSVKKSIHVKMGTFIKVKKEKIITENKRARWYLKNYYNNHGNIFIFLFKRIYYKLYNIKKILFK